MKIVTQGRTTILTIEAVPEKRPAKRGRRPDQNDFYARRQIEGRCVPCGKVRQHYKYRCDACQEIERVRHKRQYPSRFHTMRAIPGKRYKEKRSVEEFLLDLRGWHATGSDIVERIRRRRQFKDRGREL